MRKCSKILGAFSMNLASLLGFVEACHRRRGARSLQSTSCWSRIADDGSACGRSTTPGCLKPTRTGFAAGRDTPPAHHHASAVRSHRGPWQDSTPQPTGPGQRESDKLET